MDSQTDRYTDRQNMDGQTCRPTDRQSMDSQTDRCTDRKNQEKIQIGRKDKEKRKILVQKDKGKKNETRSERLREKKILVQKDAWTENYTNRITQKDIQAK